MKVGPLFIGWVSLSESDRIALGLDPRVGGWKVFGVEWNGNGFSLFAVGCE